MQRWLSLIYDLKVESAQSATRPETRSRAVFRPSQVNLKYYDTSIEGEKIIETFLQIIWITITSTEVMKTLICLSFLIYLYMWLDGCCTLVTIVEPSIIDWLWIRATLACRLLEEAAVQAPALPLLNWSPQNHPRTQTSQSHWKIILRSSENWPLPFPRAGRSPSISSFYHFGFSAVLPTADTLSPSLYLVSLHLKITIRWGRLWENHTSGDRKEGATSEEGEIAGTNGRWLRTAWWVIGF